MSSYVEVHEFLISQGYNSCNYCSAGWMQWLPENGDNFYYTAPFIIYFSYFSAYGQIMKQGVVCFRSCKYRNKYIIYTS